MGTRYRGTASEDNKEPGCNFPKCPGTSIYIASERDFKVALIEDTVSGLYPKGREEMLNIGFHLLKSESVKLMVQIKVTQ